ncbi:putative mycolyltransferase [Gordonia effusa NBRC 100432]|uniref:Putative mycolyltransferase n=1 Tax=Gordonia effusa NBRC 100432 TaxID=1077974 RepID=H0QV52_9ACTN|nr:alpha/beta hydrolase-fold protein [Gordonia effusa]GAB16703.1 putative mycolyltransferase [Gordonia effusa NBRC 100432]
MSRVRFAGAVTIAIGLLVSGVLLGRTPESPVPVAHVGHEATSSKVTLLQVFSPSMGKMITNQVIRAKPGSPTLVLLNGKGGGIEGDSWQNFTSYQRFFADKNVNVVSPLGGAYSMSTDWRSPDPVRGVNKWQTYLIHELPTAINKVLKANGRNAIAGLSLTGGTALDVAAHGGSLYRAAASYSGCPNISNPVAAAGLAASVLSGGANPLNMFTPSDWVNHDVAANPERLRGKAIYLGSATGAPGVVDNAGPHTAALLLGPAQVEAFTDWCTRKTSAALDQAGVAHFHARFPGGAHTWALFYAELRDSWFRVLGPALRA